MGGAILVSRSRGMSPCLKGSVMQAMIVYPVSTTDPEHTLLFPSIREARAYVAALAAHLEQEYSGLEPWEVIREREYAEASFEEDYRRSHPGVFALLSEQHDRE